MQRACGSAASAWQSRPVAGLVYGSGFEAHPQLLAAIGDASALLGNRPEAVQRLKDPVQFAVLCDSLGIDHPAIALTPPGGARSLAAQAARRQRRPA